MSQPVSAPGQDPTKPKPRTSSRVSSALKSGVVYGGSAVLTAVSNLTPHIAGAVDILVVEQPDGTRKASPFYVRFGKYTALRTGERNVKLTVNGQPAPFGMHIGMYGQAYFATHDDADGDEEEQEALLAGVMSPPSGYSSGADGEGADAGEVQAAVQRNITGGIRAMWRRSNGVADAGGRGSGADGAGNRPVPALGTTAAHRLGAAATAGAVAEGLSPDALQGVGEIAQALQAQLAPALSANDRNESFLSASETLAGPLGDEIVAAAVAACASSSLLASPDLTSRRLPQRQPHSGSRGRLQPAGGSTDSLQGYSEGASPCGWSEDEEAEVEAEEELAVRRSEEALLCNGRSPEGAVPVSPQGSGAGVGAEVGPWGAAVPQRQQPAAEATVQHDRVSPVGSVATEAAPAGAAAPQAELQPPAPHLAQQHMQQYAIPAPLHLQVGFPENHAAMEPFGSGGVDQATGMGNGPTAVGQQEAGPRLPATVDWAQVLGGHTVSSADPHSVSAAAGAVSTAALPIAAAAGRPGVAAAGRHRASPAGGSLAAAVAADGVTHGSGSHHAVSLLSSSLKCNSSGGAGTFAGGGCGAVGAPAPAALPGQTPTPMPVYPSDDPPAPAMTVPAASFTDACRGQGTEQRLVALALRTSSDGRVHLRLHALPSRQPQAAPAARLATSASPFGQAHGGSNTFGGAVGRPIETATSCVSEGGYLGDTEPSSLVAAGRHPHHTTQCQPISQHQSHHAHYTHMQSLHHRHSHGNHEYLHSTSAPLPSSAIDAVAAAKERAAAAAPAAAASSPLLPAPGLQLSLCGGRLTAQTPYANACALFDVNSVSEEVFVTHGSALLASPELVVRLSNGAMYPWHVLSHSLVSLLAFGTWRVPPGAVCWVPEGAAPCDAASAAALLASAAQGAGAAAAGAGRGGAAGGGEVDGVRGVGSATTTPKKGASGSVSSWLWPFGSRRDRSSITGGGGSGRAAGATSGRSPPPPSSPLEERQASLDRPSKGGGAGPASSHLPRRQSSGLQSEPTADGAAGGLGNGTAAAAGGGEGRRQGSGGFTVTKKSLTATAEQLATLPLKRGQNTITYRIGGSELKAYVYYLHWRTKIVISDIDGTITKSDVLGHLLPAMGLDWSHPGIAELLTNICGNNYQIMYLSSRSISQANITRDFINTLVQGQHRMPLGPVIISPHGLLPSLYREMILRRPHEFKIETLMDIRALFPSDWNPFYGGFGNRDTDEISYREVGVQSTRIFIINPRGELRQPICQEDDSSDESPIADIETGLEPSGGSLTTTAGPVDAALRPPAAARTASGANGGRSRGAAAATDAALSSLSAINQLVHDIFPPRLDRGFPPSPSASSSSASSSLSGSATSSARSSGSSVLEEEGGREAGAQAPAAGPRATQRGPGVIAAAQRSGRGEGSSSGASSGRSSGVSSGRSSGEHSGGAGGGSFFSDSPFGEGSPGAGLGRRERGPGPLCSGTAGKGGPPVASTPQSARSPRGASAGGSVADSRRGVVTPGYSPQDSSGASMVSADGSVAARSDTRSASGGGASLGCDGGEGVLQCVLPCGMDAGGAEATLGPAAVLEGVATTVVGASVA